MLDFILGFVAAVVVINLMGAIINAVIRKVGNVIHIGGEEDNPDYVAPIATSEDEGEAYLNRRPL